MASCLPPYPKDLCLGMDYLSILHVINCLKQDKGSLDCTDRASLRFVEKYLEILVEKEKVRIPGFYQLVYKSLCTNLSKELDDEEFTTILDSSYEEISEILINKSINADNIKHSINLLQAIKEQVSPYARFIKNEAVW